MLGDLLLRVLADLAGERSAPTCFVIRGEVGQGKTRTAEALAAELREHSVSVGGVIAPRLLHGDETIGYDVRDVVSGEEECFARLTPPGTPIGRFFIRAEGVFFARDVLERDQSSADVVVLDEVGRLELRHKGHSTALRALLASPTLPVLTVRSALVTEVCESFGIARVAVHDVAP